LVSFSGLEDGLDTYDTFTLYLPVASIAIEDMPMAPV
jgi:hypothetical protein